MLRVTAGGIPASLAPALNFGALLSSGPAPTTPGTGYAPGDAITLAGGTATTNATVVVADTQVVSATVAAGGTGGTSGTQTVTGTTGTTGVSGIGRFSASVTISGGAITAVNSITSGGDYIINPTSLAAEPVTGAGLTGAQLNVVMGVKQFVVQNIGLYTLPPSGNPATVAQGSTTGAGTGATFPVSFGPIASGMVFPSLNENHAANADNFSLGNGALSSLTTGYFNLAIGVNALSLNTTGPESLAIGWNSLQHYTGVGNAGNVALGTASARALTTGVNNVAIGTDALNGPTTANNNIIIGNSAVSGGGGDIGDGNIAIGLNAMKFGTAARVTNVAIGQNALVGKSDNTSAPTRMTVIGNQAINGGSLGAPARTVVIGDIAGAATFSSSDSVLIGSTAGKAITSGASQVIIGSNAGGAITTGASNVIIGKNVAQTTLVSGANNVLIGTNSSIDTAAAATSNTIQIGAGSTAILSVTGTDTPATSLAAFAGTLKALTTTVASLPAASTAGAGARAFVTDATASTFASTVVGGSSTNVPVYSDGTNWKIG